MVVLSREKPCISMVDSSIALLTTNWSNRPPVIKRDGTSPNETDNLLVNVYISMEHHHFIVKTHELSRAMS